MTLTSPHKSHRIVHRIIVQSYQLILLNRQLLILRYFTIILFTACMASASAQSNSNLRTLRISAQTDTIVLDTLSIIPGSVLIATAQGNIISDSVYVINYATATLTWQPTMQAYIEDSLTVVYRVMPLLFSKKFQRKDEATTLAGNKLLYDPSNNQNKNSVSDPFGLGGIEKSGSISRGITVGNNQDVIVNSSLNLQLSGKISDEIEILAAISDENIPIQPDGNTQQLQDFDKVFIQLSDHRHKLIAGDYELARPDGYFMNFYKKAQGISFSSLNLLGTRTKPDTLHALKTTSSISFSKGKYARNQIVAIEGNQGPYKLRGGNNELFIIVLSGTEKVFIDGELMARGADSDYIIDYNLAEISFTPLRLVTKDSRIIVEFEYSEKNYARSLLFNSTEYAAKKFKVRINAYSEQDNKNQPSQINLDDDRKALLAQLGDNIDSAFVLNVDSVEFNTSEILYARIDTMVSLQTYSVYYYSTNPDSAHFRVGFANVGAGKGNYNTVNTTANGRVYQWVAPLNGIPQGSYDPIIKLITPTKQQLVTLGTQYQLTEKTLLNSEFALSHSDANLFSNLDDGDNTGFAYKLQLDDSRPVFKQSKNDWAFNSQIIFEHTNDQFKPIERYRNVEFTRDWNLQNTTNQLNEEYLGLASIGLRSAKKGMANYAIQYFERPGAYTGLLHGLKSDLSHNGYRMQSEGTLLNSESEIINSTFIRNRGELSKQWRWIKPGIKHEFETNKLHINNSDSLSVASLQYHLVGAYLSSADTSTNKYRLEHTIRDDNTVQKNEFRHSSRGQTTLFNVAFQRNPKHRFVNTTTVRTLLVSDTTTTKVSSGTTVLNRIEHYISTFKGAFSASTFYEVGTGQEQKKEFVYLEVAAGSGLYTWTDYNNNGIKELDEFEIAPFPDLANYIRILAPTNQFVGTFNNQINEVINIQPAALRSGDATKKTIYRFSLQSQVRMEKKILNEVKLAKALNPFDIAFNDSLLISNNSLFRNTIFYNRTSQIFGADATVQNGRNKSILSNGFESRQLDLYNLNLRLNISSSIGFSNTADYGVKQFNSQFFTSKNYRINSISSEPKVSYQSKVAWRWQLAYKYSNKENTLSTLNEKSLSNKLSSELRYNTPKKGSYSAKASFINIDYNAQVNTPIAFEMLEGFRPGNNFTWGISLQRNMSSGLTMTLNYDGRKSVDTRSIHTGGVQVRAFF